MPEALAPAFGKDGTSTACAVMSAAAMMALACGRVTLLVHEKRHRSAAARGTMSYCEHCEGQRFDRAQVLRALRTTRKTVRKHSGADKALGLAIKTVRSLEVPHLDRIDDTFDGERVH